MVCLRNVCIKTLHKGDSSFTYNDDDGDDHDNNNNNNGKVEVGLTECQVT
jgi:hypothetical protein